MVYSSWNMNKTVIYTSATCAYCPMVKKYLDRFNVDYEERDIEVGNNHKESIEASGAFTVPVVVSGDRVVVGYQPLKLRSIFQG